MMRAAPHPIRAAGRAVCFGPAAEQANSVRSAAPSGSPLKTLCHGCSGILSKQTRPAARQTAVGAFAAGDTQVASHTPARRPFFAIAANMVNQPFTILTARGVS